jgi:hypothetical protein
MVKKSVKKREKKEVKKRISVLKFIGLGLLFLIKIPYFIVKGIYYLIRRVSKKNRENAIKRNRELMEPVYREFDVLKVISGNYGKWLKKVYESDSRIGIVLGARGSGKTAFGIKFLENFHVRNKKKCFAMGFNENELPFWIRGVKEVGEIENDSFVLIDEGGVLFNSRSTMSNANKLLSQLMLIARHKNISILFISQNSSNLEINILRQADFLVLKPSSLLQKDFERKIVQKIYESAREDFDKFSDSLGIAYIYAGEFRGFVSNPLPSFWKENLGKAFK